MLGQDDSLSLTQDTQSVSSQSQPSSSTAEPSLSSIPYGSDSSIVITQSTQEEQTQASPPMDKSPGTQSLNLHLSNTETLTQSQSLFSSKSQSISDSPSDSMLIRAAAEANTGLQGDSDITTSSQLPDDTNNTSDIIPVDDRQKQQTLTTVSDVSDVSEMSEILIPLISPNTVTVEDIGNFPDDTSDVQNPDETIIDNRKPLSNRPASTPKRGHDVTLNATSAASPIPSQSDMSKVKQKDEAANLSGSQKPCSSKPNPTQSNTSPSTVQDKSPIFFKIQGDYPWLSNMYQDDELTKFEMCDYPKWKSREHCYQWRKAIFHEEWALANAIISAPTAEEAKALGSQIVCNPEWHAKKKSVMYEIICAFCEQKNWFVDKLVSTGQRRLCENTSNSDWGVLNGGSNWLGEILMQQRSDYLLQQEHTSDGTVSQPNPTPQPTLNEKRCPPANPYGTNKHQGSRKEKEQNAQPPTVNKGKKVLLFGDSMPDLIPLEIPGMECKVRSHSGARVTVPKTAGSNYVPSSTLLKNDMDGDEEYIGLMIGANDSPHTNVTKFKASYRMLVKTAKSKGAKVICHQIFHRGDRRDLNSKIDTFNHAIFQVAMEEECACVNATSSYNSTAWKPNINMLAGGRLHLKPWAKRTVANRLSTVIRQIDSVVSSPPSTAPRHSPRRHSPRRHSPRSPRRHSPRRHFPRVHSRRPGPVNQTEMPEDGRWDSCYRPTPGYYRQNPNNRWQQYPMSTGHPGAW